MHTHVLLSFDLKQNTDSETRKLFDEALEGRGWKDCSDVGSTKVRVFVEDADISGLKVNAYMEVVDSALRANVKELACVIQCGNSEVLQKTFLHPKLNKLAYG
ncbi:hypothetical protein [Pseudomonas fluorescens]|uniref:hypothetical protein n=1 Tax=Pseudomonas fluorescens TaxID=294 RepID=UPI003821DD1C